MALGKSVEKKFGRRRHNARTGLSAELLAVTGVLDQAEENFFERLVGRHQAEWIDGLRDALKHVEEVRNQGPDAAPAS